MQKKIILILIALLFSISTGFGSAIASATAQDLKAESGYRATADDWRGVIADMQYVTEKVAGPCNQYPGRDAISSGQRAGQGAGINGAFPGSTFSCAQNGSGIVVIDNTKYYFGYGTVLKIEKNLGYLTHEYSFTNDVVKVTDGTNYIVFKIDLQHPRNSEFLDASLPIVAEEAEIILPKKQKGINLRSRLVLLQLLKGVFEGYTDGDSSMFVVANSILSRPDYRQKFIEILPEVSRETGGGGRR